MLKYVLTPDGHGILVNRKSQVVKRRLCISIPYGATAYVSGKACRCDGGEAWISVSALQHINTVRITLDGATWCCEGFAYTDGIITPLGFDTYQSIVSLTQEMVALSTKVEEITAYIREQKQAQDTPLFF